LFGKRRMPNGTYGVVRGVGVNLSSYSILLILLKAQIRS